MFNKSIPSFHYYKRLKDHMKFNEYVWKENVDIKAVFHKMKTPYYKRIQTKLEQNKKKITMFCIMVGICKLTFLYQWMLGTIPYKKKLFNSFKAYCLGLETVYQQGVVEQIFQNELDQQLIGTFLELDNQLPMGITRKLIIKCLKEIQHPLTKEEIRQFYNASGFIDSVYGKMSGINLKELNYIISKSNLRNKQLKLNNALLELKTQHQSWQENKLTNLQNQLPIYKFNDIESVTKRIQPVYDKF